MGHVHLMPVEVVFHWLKDEIEGGCRRQELRSPRRAPTQPVMVSLPFEVMMVSSPLLPVKADAQPPRHRRDFRRDRPNRRFFGQIGAELHY